LAHSCNVSTDWLITRIQAGLLSQPVADPEQANYTSTELTRARRLYDIEQQFDANPELAALVVDMMEEIEVLRCQIQTGATHFIDS
ncbi:MAG: hypothetical protein ABL868_04080, partial [Sulfuriferula sp.]